MTTIAQGIEQVNKILRETYGYNHGVVNSPSYVLLWSFEYLTDVVLAKKLISKINRLREKNGNVLIQIPYGHRFF